MYRARAHNSVGADVKQPDNEKSALTALKYPSWEKELQDVIVQERDTGVELACTCRDLINPKATWYHRGREIFSDFHMKLRLAACTATLTIKTIRERDAGQFKCLMVGENGELESSCVLTIATPEQLEPPAFVKELHDLEVEAGEKLEMDVKVKGTSPIRVVWYHNNVQITQDNPHFLLASLGHIHTLTLLNTRQESSGEYVCEAYNQFGDTETFCFIDVKEVEHPEPPDFVNRPLTLTAQEGENVTFTCQVKGQPAPIVLWERGGVAIATNQKYKITKILDQHSLTVFSLDQTDTGEYICHLHNTEGNKSHVFSLYVGDDTHTRRNETVAALKTRFGNSQEPSQATSEVQSLHENIVASPGKPRKFKHQMIVGSGITLRNPEGNSPSYNSSLEDTIGSGGHDQLPEVFSDKVVDCLSQHQPFDASLSGGHSVNSKAKHSAKISVDSNRIIPQSYLTPGSDNSGTVTDFRSVLNRRERKGEVKNKVISAEITDFRSVLKHKERSSHHAAENSNQQQSDISYDKMLAQDKVTQQTENTFESVSDKRKNNRSEIRNGATVPNPNLDFSQGEKDRSFNYSTTFSGSSNNHHREGLSIGNSSSVNELVRGNSLSVNESVRGHYTSVIEPVLRNNKAVSDNNDLEDFVDSDSQIGLCVESTSTKRHTLGSNTNPTHSHISSQNFEKRDNVQKLIQQTTASLSVGKNIERTEEQNIMPRRGVKDSVAIKTGDATIQQVISGTPDSGSGEALFKSEIQVLERGKFIRKEHLAPTEHNFTVSVKTVSLAEGVQYMCDGTGGNSSDICKESKSGTLDSETPKMGAAPSHNVSVIHFNPQTPPTSGSDGFKLEVTSITVSLPKKPPVLPWQHGESLPSTALGQSASSLGEVRQKVIDNVSTDISDGPVSFHTKQNEFTSTSQSYGSVFTWEKAPWDVQEVTQRSILSNNQLEEKFYYSNTESIHLRNKISSSENLQECEISTFKESGLVSTASRLRRTSMYDSPVSTSNIPVFDSGDLDFRTVKLRPAATADHSGPSEKSRCRSASAEHIFASVKLKAVPKTDDQWRRSQISNSAEGAHTKPNGTGFSDYSYSSSQRDRNLQTSNLSFTAKPAASQLSDSRKAFDADQKSGSYPNCIRGEKFVSNSNARTNTMKSANPPLAANTKTSPFPASKGIGAKFEESITISVRSKMKNTDSFSSARTRNIIPDNKPNLSSVSVEPNSGKLSYKLEHWKAIENSTSVDIGKKTLGVIGKSNSSSSILDGNRKLYLDKAERRDSLQPNLTTLTAKSHKQTSQNQHNELDVATKTSYKFENSKLNLESTRSNQSSDVSDRGKLFNKEDKNVEMDFNKLKQATLSSKKSNMQQDRKVINNSENLKAKNVYVVKNEQEVLPDWLNRKSVNDIEARIKANKVASQEDGVKPEWARLKVKKHNTDDLVTQEKQNNLKPDAVKKPIEFSDTSESLEAQIAKTPKSDMKICTEVSIPASIITTATSGVTAIDKEETEVSSSPGFGNIPATSDRGRSSIIGVSNAVSVHVSDLLKNENSVKNMNRSKQIPPPEQIQQSSLTKDARPWAKQKSHKTYSEHDFELFPNHDLHTISMDDSESVLSTTSVSSSSSDASNMTADSGYPRSHPGMFELAHLFSDMPHSEATINCSKISYTGKSITTGILINKDNPLSTSETKHNFGDELSRNDRSRKTDSQILTGNTNRLREEEKRTNQLKCKTDGEKLMNDHGQTRQQERRQMDEYKIKNEKQNMKESEICASAADSEEVADLTHDFGTTRKYSKKRRKNFQKDINDTESSPASSPNFSPRDSRSSLDYVYSTHESEIKMVKVPTALTSIASEQEHKRKSTDIPATSDLAEIGSVVGDRGSRIRDRLNEGNSVGYHTQNIKPLATRPSDLDLTPSWACSRSQARSLIKDKGVEETMLRKANLEDKVKVPKTGRETASRAASLISSPEPEQQLQPPSFPQPLQDISVPYGSKAVFQCRILGNPKPEVKWLLNHILVEPSQNMEIVNSDVMAQLTLRETFTEHVGDVTCWARNALGTVSTHCTLAIEASNKTEGRAFEGPVFLPPKIVSLTRSAESLTPGSEFIITATFVGEPRPEVTWMRGDKQVLPDGRIHIMTEGSTSCLTITSLDLSDVGEISICLSSCTGVDRASTKICVESVPGAPEGRPHVYEIGRNSASVSWSCPASSEGSQVAYYIIEAKTRQEQTWDVLVPQCKDLSCHIQGLKPCTTYQFRVLAANKHGVSGPSEPSERVITYDLFGTPSDYESEDDFPFEPRVVDVNTNEKFEDVYELDKEVGKGKFGIVYKCKNKKDGTIWAAKVVKCREKDKSVIRREIDIMNKLRHPKLLLLRDAYESPRQMVLVTEYVGAGELFERVVGEDFVLTERDCVHFLRQICEGVSYMHGNNILHLDLKPENILCIAENSNRIKIIDFGLAQFYEQGQSTKVLFGTPEFIAPEVVNYDEISFVTDMWSIGVICYVLLSGLSPFLGDSDAETLSNVTNGEFDFDDEAFDEISDDAKNFISQLLVMKKEERMLTENCLAHVWLSQDQNPCMRTRRLNTDRLKRFMVRRKWLKTGNAVVAVSRLLKSTNLGGLSSHSISRVQNRPVDSTLQHNIQHVVAKVETDSYSDDFTKKHQQLDSNVVLMSQDLVENVLSGHGSDLITIEDNWKHTTRRERTDDTRENVRGGLSRLDFRGNHDIQCTDQNENCVVSENLQILVLSDADFNDNIKHTACSSSLKQTDETPALLQSEARGTDLKKCGRNEPKQEVRTVPNVVHAQAPVFTKSMKNCQACAGDVARFDVVVSSDPPPPHVIWFFEGEQIHPDSRHALDCNESIRSFSLVIRNIEEDDEGEYTCKAVNSHGESICVAELSVLEF